MSVEVLSTLGTLAPDPIASKTVPVFQQAHVEGASLPPEVYNVIRKVQAIEKAVGISQTDRSPVAQAEQHVLQASIHNLHSILRQSSSPSVLLPPSGFKSVISWIEKAISGVAATVCQIATYPFKKRQNGAQVIAAILDELKTCQAISPAQYEKVLELSQKADKNPALMLLATHLGFSTRELSVLLSSALHASPEKAFSLLLECYLIKIFSTTGSFQTVLNDNDRRCLSKISIDSLGSSAHLSEQLACLRSLSYRATVQTWIANLSVLLQTDVDPSLIQRCTEAVKNNDAKRFVKELSPLLIQVASKDICNESLYAKELLSLFQEKFSFEDLGKEIRQQKFLSQWGDQLADLKKATKALLTTQRSADVGKRVLSEALSILKQQQIKERYTPSWKQICSTFRATQEGAMARNFRKIEALVKRIGVGEAHTAEAEDALKDSKHVLHLACSCGGGHQSMVQAMNSSIRAASSHSRYQLTTDALDVPTQVTKSVDAIYNLFHKFGIDIDTTWVYNFLLRHDLCSVIEFAKWLTSGEPSKASVEKKQSLIRQAILTRDPDFLDMVYAFDGNDIDEVSQQLGLPLGYVATDFDLDDWQHLPKSRFFKEAVCSLSHPEIRSTLKIPEEHVEEIGLCVGPEFETPLSAEQLAAVRERYGVTQNEKVVLFSSGGAALQNTTPEQIAFEYNDPSTPIHMIVVCGKNESFKNYLETKVLPRIPQGAPVKVTVVGFQQKAQMAELAQLADVAIGKPGGLSTMEFVKAGTRVIFDITSHRMKWERFNAKVVVESGRGTVMEDSDQLLPLLKDSLQKPRPVPMSMAQARASERYVRFVDRLLTSANQPAADDGWREKRRSWHTMNKTMARLVMV
jgi:hypothetical protein